MAMNADMFGSLLGGDGSRGLGGFDLMGILDLLRQLYAVRAGGGQQMGLRGAADSGAQQGGGAGQLPRLPGGGPGQPLQGGAFSNGRGDTFDAAGNPLTFAGVTSPQTTMPTDRVALIQSLARSTQPDRYGNTPWVSATPGSATVPHLPNFGAPPRPGDMADPRNWDPTAWVNHPEWHSAAVDQAQRTYEVLHGLGNAGRPYSANNIRNAQRDWQSFGYGNKQEWKQAGRPIGQGYGG